MSVMDRGSIIIDSPAGQWLYDQGEAAFVARAFGDWFAEFGMEWTSYPAAKRAFDYDRRGWELVAQHGRMMVGR